jgi:phosphatidylinositol glycan class W
MVLPILLGVTVFANRPYTFNAILLAVAGLFYLQSPSNFHEPASRMGSSMSGGQQKSKGEWLDESDSDEEPAEPLESASLQVPPSRPISAMSSSISRPSSPTPSSSMLQPETPTDQKARKRRHSPTPSTHNHTAIDILPTPEMSGPGRMVNQQSTYPSPMAARLKQAQGTLPFLSVYRAHMMIMTLHCILAVDFKVFPRIQGKCEDFGTSLVRCLARITADIRWTLVWGHSYSPLGWCLRRPLPRAAPIARSNASPSQCINQYRLYCSA